MNISHTQNGFGITNTGFAIITNAGVPSAAIGVGVAGKGSICIDVANGKLYVNAGTIDVPSWKLVTQAA